MSDYNSKLQRRLTLLNVWSLAFGGIIGWGAFVMPGTVFLKRAGTLGTLIAMETAALIMLIMSYNYAYMLKRYPVSGGEFVYAKRSFGKTHGFICAWFMSLCYISIIPMNATALCLVFRAVCGNIFQFGFHYVIAGYDIYMGEMILALSALFFFAYVCSLPVNIAGKLQTVFAGLLLGGVLIILAGVIFDSGITSSKLLPMFLPKDSSHGGYTGQVISVLVVAPWAFVGFDIVPKVSEESAFPADLGKNIMDSAILCGCFVYVVLTMIAASGTPESYSGWVEYVDALPGLSGISGIATFSAAYKVLGRAGVWVISISALSAMLTGILAFYTATSRLLYSMSGENMLPSWFGELNRNNVPFNAVKFCLVVSALAPFAGRNALGWTVDMSSIGGAVSLAYTSLASVRFAVKEKRIDMIIFGSVGFVFSVMFALLLLIPVEGLECSLEGPSYILLAIWVILGVMFWRNMLKDKN